MRSNSLFDDYPDLENFDKSKSPRETHFCKNKGQDME